MENRKLKLRTYIEEQWEKSLPEMHARECKLKIETNFINDIIGPRRAGKTYLMQYAIKQLVQSTERKSIIYINFENRKLFPLNAEYFNDLIEIIHQEELLEKYPKVYLFLDEIQKISKWEKYIRSIHDEFKEKIKIFVSGSTSKLTQSKFSHLLTGRHLTTVIFPLNFREFTHFHNMPIDQKILTEKNQAKIEKLLKHYLTNGGFPEATLEENEEIVETLLLDILNRDIAPKVKHKEIIEEVAYFLCSNAAQLTSFSKLSKTLKMRGINISVPTLEKYFWLMKDAFLFFDIQIFSYKVKDQLQYPRKIYCIDNGFINYFGFKFIENKGRMLENCVAVQLFHRSLEQPKTQIFYWKNVQHQEVDFVIKEGIQIKQLIQACWNLDEPETKKREINALIKASQELKCNKLLIITENKEGKEKNNGKTITYIPLWKWLLEN